MHSRFRVLKSISLRQPYSSCSEKCGLEVTQVFQSTFRRRAFGRSWRDRWSYSYASWKHTHDLPLRICGCGRDRLRSLAIAVEWASLTRFASRCIWQVTPNHGGTLSSLSKSSNTGLTRSYSRRRNNGGNYLLRSPYIRKAYVDRRDCCLLTNPARLVVSTTNHFFFHTGYQRFCCCDMSPKRRWLRRRLSPNVPSD